MPKVYPSRGIGLSATTSNLNGNSSTDGDQASVLTVWKKSLIFNCNGFTVYDSKGDLVFRVDNYMEGHRGEILLMDASGKPLFTIRRKKRNLGDCWMVYEGETALNPKFSVRRHVNIRNTKCLAYAMDKSSVLYEIEGSYAQRCVTVVDEKKRRVAEIGRKEAVRGVTLGADVFRLTVQPGTDTAAVMALIVLLDQMFGSNRRFGA